ncbi:hypothetical protein BLA60_34335 [Actinophytocola xinjiangensis]|uniref:DUF418 domain-containing protein n=1 Tax=Actinophytocola xinjiangensis TaxID=485602 RepID=A0A7Z1AVP1_9PSEU|nr:hypothetical protein BLA60_34335 [Actinophytocola xinjiangensis]
MAPDLARGFMLLLIALGHSSVLRAAWSDGGYSNDDPISAFYNAAAAVLLDGRGAALFAFLFGYGLSQMYLRYSQRGYEWPKFRGLIQRRGFWLLVIGLLHTALLFFGDLLAAYGVVTLIFFAALRWTSRSLWITGSIFLTAGTLVYAFGIPQVFQSLSQPETVTPLSDMLYRFQWPMMIPLVVVGAVFPVLVGIWAARKRLLDEPHLHRSYLRKVAVYGILITIVLGLPYALINGGYIMTESMVVYNGTYWINQMGGYFGGFAYAALFGLLAAKIGDRRNKVVNALVATGQRSLSCYLFQSLCWMVLGAPYLIGLGNTMSELGALGVGALVWIFALCVSALMAKRGVRGPVEIVYRRLTYGRSASSNSKAEPKVPAGV